MDETWVAVDGFGGRYEVSSKGRVRNRKTGRILRPCNSGGKRSCGHLQVVLCWKGTRTHRKVHHLVLEGFVGPRPGDAVGRHLDDNPLNNAADNLAWGTRAENIADAFRNGKRQQDPRSLRCVNGHLATSDNVYTFQSGWAWACGTCMTESLMTLQHN